jgi:ribosomal-protein-alanine N-acetyltransferase
MIFQTERLIIRKFKPADLASLIDMFSDQQVMRFIGPRSVLTESEIQAWLSDKLHRQDHELTRYAMALNTTDELIGVAGLRDEAGVKYFGYYFRKAYWGKGYAREACSAIIDPIETTLQIKDYQIFIADENISSKERHKIRRARICL